MTLLLEGKESRAHAMMDEFQFTGDTDEVTGSIPVMGSRTSSESAAGN
jgi:hypothetical protein